MADGYRRAIERALERVMVRNGIVSIRDLWFETALPMDLIADARPCGTGRSGTSIIAKGATWPQAIASSSEPTVGEG